MQIRGGIASSTHLDDHGQRIAKDLLDEMAERIRAVYVALLVEHDSGREVGVVLNGRVIDLGDGEYALLVLTGEFDGPEDVSRYPKGEANAIWQDLESTMDEVEESVRAEYSAVEVEPVADTEELSVAEGLQRFLDTTEVDEDGVVRLVKKRFASLFGHDIDVYTDHDPPHFHVISRQKKIDVRFDLDTLEVYRAKRGEIDRRDARRIQEYFRSHPHEHERLKDMYRSMNPLDHS